MKASSRYCIRGEQCTQYAALGESSKLRRESESSICEACRKADADAEFREASRGASTALPKTSTRAYERSRQQDARVLASDAERWIKDFKNKLVISLYKKRGPFWEAVREVRERWNIEAKAELPPTTPLSTPPSPGDYFLLPEEAPDYYADAEHEEWNDFSSRWHLDIFRIQQQTMPEKYGGEDWWPQWRNFLSACVLYDPLREDLLAFAAYDDELVPDLVLPPDKREYTDSDDPSELPLMVASPIRSLGDLVRPHDEFWIERFWELLEQLKLLGFEHKSLVHDILLILERREEYLLEIEQNQSSHFIEVDEHTTVKDAERAVPMITAAQEERPASQAPRRARLIAVQCALDYELPECTYKKLAERYKLGSTDTARRYVEDGQKFLEET